MVETWTNIEKLKNRKHFLLCLISVSELKKELDRSLAPCQFLSELCLLFLLRKTCDQWSKYGYYQEGCITCGEGLEAGWPGRPCRASGAPGREIPVYLWKRARGWPARAAVLGQWSSWVRNTDIPVEKG
jgi:hypothetical protein